MGNRGAWAGSSNWAWSQVRRRVLAENLELNEGRCLLALPGVWRTKSGRTLSCRGVADCVHHVLGRARTGDDPRYLQAACTPCNERVGDPLKPGAVARMRRGDGGSESVAVSRW